ncbi:histidine kinase [Planobispora rosea]|uniref:histidine kinase n=1 Tax=Planobispora rosea TaxID=35762 RepID=A0A8J3S2P0_PLARO|nr:sensor histidine kinase [Planobispora rosea]GGS78521.1 histidine kinase [Planobispora rosea]GIH85679.1 histidine kinase [Planobispora rosea]
MPAEETLARPPVSSRAGRWSAQAWFALVLATMAVLLCVSTVGGALALQYTAEVSNRLVDRISPARVEGKNLEAALLDQESGVRGFVLTGKEEFLEPYTLGREAEIQAAARIRQLNPGRRLRELEELERLAAEWRARHAEPMVALTRTDGPERVTPAQAQESKESFDAVRHALDAYNDAWSRARDMARADLGAARATRDTVFMAIVGALLLAVVAMAVLLRLVVFRPLDRLSAASRRVTSGDFSHHVDTGGPADLAELARDMEAMRGRIVAELEETRRSQRLLAERAEELKRSNTELEQFAYVASHDLQEPLRKVASFTQMLEQRYGDQLDDRAKQYIAFSVDGAKRMQELINELLTFSRVGRITRDPVTFGLGDAVASARRNLSAAIEDADAVIEVGDLPVISGDRSQFVMLWQNLIGNAVKFRRPDRAPVIRIEGRREGPEWHISVADNGIGIDARFAEKIFIIFQRLHTRDAYPGTGIGLAICRKIVEYHHGRIWLDTGYTDGTRFVIALPAPDDPTADGEEPSSVSGASGASEISGSAETSPASPASPASPKNGDGVSAS